MVITDPGRKNHSLMREQGQLEGAEREAVPLLKDTKAAWRLFFRLE